MESCSGRCTGNGKQGDCRADELFLWIYQKCDYTHFFKTGHREEERATEITHRIIST